MQVIIALAPHPLGPRRRAVNQPLSPAEERRAEAVCTYLAEIRRSTRRKGAEQRIEVQRMLRQISTVELSLEDIEVCVRAIAESLATLDYFQMGPILFGPTRDDAVDVLDRLQGTLPTPIPLITSLASASRRHPIALHRYEIQVILALSSYCTAGSGDDRSRGLFGRSEGATIEAMLATLSAAWDRISGAPRTDPDAETDVQLSTDEVKLIIRIIGACLCELDTPAMEAYVASTTRQQVDVLFYRLIEFVRSVYAADDARQASRTV